MRWAWFACFAVAATGSLWCLLSWNYAPSETRVYYVAIMSIGALTLGYTLTAARIVGVTALLVTLVPISIALLASGDLHASALAVGLLIAVAFQALLIERHQRLLLELVHERNHSRELSLTDPLTGVANRRALLEMARKMAARGDQLRLMVLDIDRFKLVNDRYGHDTGDEVLMIVATLLSDYASSSIGIARLGGEEFAIVGKAADLPPSLARSDARPNSSGGNAPWRTAYSQHRHGGGNDETCRRVVGIIPPGRRRTVCSEGRRKRSGGPVFAPNQRREGSAVTRHDPGESREDAPST